MEHRSSFRKMAMWGIAGLLGLVVVGLLVAVVVYPPAYVVRVLIWQDADVQDYQRFPSTPVRAAEEPFLFAEAPDQARVTEIVERSDQVADFDQFMQETGTQAFIVIQNDAVVYESYFNGYQRDSIVTSFSVAKSFGSALIGIAIENGDIGSVNDPITRYLPELLERDPRFAEIAIRDLLLMSSGISYVEFPFLNGDDAKTYYYPDLRQLTLEQTEIAGPPGESFLYNNFHPLLIGLILERATGKPVSALLQDEIWTQIGTEYDASWSLDNAATAFEKMESGINGRAIDFARFGRLYLYEGNWNGVQVVPADWVRDSVSAGFVNDNPGYYSQAWGPKLYNGGSGAYHYMWYTRIRDDGEIDFFAEGNKGQIIYVSPSRDMVIVRFGERYGIGAFEWISLFAEFAQAYD